MVDTKKNNSSNTKKNLMNAYKTLRTAESKMDYCAIIGSIYLIVIRLRPSIIGDLYEFFCIGMGVCGLRINKILSFLEIISVISICLCIILRVSSFVEKVIGLSKRILLNSLLSCYKKKIGRKGELVTTNGSS